MVDLKSGLRHVETLGHLSRGAPWAVQDMELELGGRSPMDIHIWACLCGTSGLAALFRLGCVGGQLWSGAGGCSLPAEGGCGQVAAA